MRDDLLQVRSFGLTFHVLRDAEGLYLIDGGFVGGWACLKRALRGRGWDREPIVGVILTHGHLDHILNIARIVAESDAWVAAPRLDLPHYQGQPVYRGIARITGCLESIGRPLLGFRPFTPDRLLDDGDTLEVWHGLTVVHLPGHTAGHSGLYCEKLGLLFCGDLFASFGRWSHLPPAFFNSDHRGVLRSVTRALELELTGVYPNHGDGSSPQQHLHHLTMLAARHRRET